MPAIESVADTAFWIATYRADEGKRPDALFSDPFAERLVEGRGRAITAQMSGGPMTAWTVAIRTRIIDDYVLQAIADGFDTVLNLGAGLDTRPYRMELPPTLRWIEVDFASTIDFKTEKLTDEKPRCQLERRRVDLSNDAARAALLDEVQASSKRALVITEGVVPYLTNAQVGALADDLHARSHLERWVLERYGSTAKRLRALAMRRRSRDLAKAPFQFEPNDWDAFFAEHGFAAREVRMVAIEGARLHRRPPMPWLMRVAISLMPKKLRDAARMGYGYAVLVRT